jgi:septum formation protein
MTTPRVREVVLASTSPYRRDLLLRLGVPFEVEPPGVDEATLTAQLGAVDPRDVPALLADAKAAAVAQRHPDRVVIGSDQVAVASGRILGKPCSIEEARSQLAMLSGATHELVTALTVSCEGEIHRHRDIARLTMRQLSGEEIARYVAADRPVDCAGSYKLEQRGIVLFERIEAADHTAITGLPLIALTTILRGLGLPLP